MSFANDAEITAFFCGDSELPEVNAQSVAGALKGFSLPLASGRTMDWLAMAIKRVLAISITHISQIMKKEIGCWP